MLQGSEEADQGARAILQAQDQIRDQWLGDRKLLL
jgi:hypothetical protein